MSIRNCHLKWSPAYLRQRVLLLGANLGIAKEQGVMLHMPDSQVLGVAAVRQFMCRTCSIQCGSYRFKLLWRQIGGIDSLHFASKLLKLASISSSWQEDRHEFDGHNAEEVVRKCRLWFRLEYRVLSFRSLDNSYAHS